MSLSSLQLDAFFETAKTLHFSKAAKNIGLTQSALSQRIAALEENLGAALFVRQSSGIRLTEPGEKLLRYCKIARELEQEIISPLRQGLTSKLTGVLRIAGFSTVLRSKVLPRLSPTLLQNPGIQIEILNREMRDLPLLLRSGNVDFIFTDAVIRKEGVVSHLFTEEEYVLIESKSKNMCEIYLDHDLEDQTTFQFLKFNRIPTQNIRRSFLDEIYSIIDAVELGLGKAVVPKHLIEGNKKLKIITGLKPLKISVYFHHLEQPYYSKLHQAVTDIFSQS
jgi:DNA-binding transcriptional LysR family regulator